MKEQEKRQLQRSLSDAVACLHACNKHMDRYRVTDTNLTNDLRKMERNLISHLEIVKRMEVDQEQDPDLKTASKRGGRDA